MRHRIVPASPWVPRYAQNGIRVSHERLREPTSREVDEANPRIGRRSRKKRVARRNRTHCDTVDLACESRRSATVSYD